MDGKICKIESDELEEVRWSFTEKTETNRVRYRSAGNEMMHLKLILTMKSIEGGCCEGERKNLGSKILDLKEYKINQTREWKSKWGENDCLSSFFAISASKQNMKEGNNNNNT